MEQGRDATACPPGESEAPVSVLHLPDAGDATAISNFVDQIRLELARGRPVVVPDWHGDPSQPRTDWSKSSLQREFNNLSREVIWQGMSPAFLMRSQEWC